MAHITLAFLGHFQVMVDDRPITAFPTDKARALLAYLAVEATTNPKAHNRHHLADLLWADYPMESARTTLRHVLHRLRDLLDADHPTPAAHPPFFLSSRETLQVNPAAGYTLDVATFTSLLRDCARHGHTDIAQCPPCLERLRQAVDLYRGDFLATLPVLDSAPFEEWRRLQQEQLHLYALDALQQLTHATLTTGEYQPALHYARRQLALEPWREEAHQQVMQALAAAGERSAALAQYESCRRLLAAELGVEPAAATVALYQQILAGSLRGAVGRTALPSPAPPSSVPSIPAPLPPPVAPPRRPLPIQPTPFLGRHIELQQIDQRLQDPHCRLLTLIGLGGMGKTRLALQAAQLLLDGGPMAHEPTTIAEKPNRQGPPPLFADGVVFVPLAGVEAAELLLMALAAALDFTFFGNADAKSQLLSYLSTKALLLILDNFEHLLAGAELVADLLATAPQVRVLVTSRERLNLREEWLLPVSGMAYPETPVAHQEQTGMTLLDYPAVQLFAQQAQRVQPAFDLAANVASVVQICRLLAGMPLGIELAAAWVRTLACPAIVRELATGIDLLATTQRNIPDRHRSLRAVFDQTWRLLTPPEQQVLAKLALFRGGFAQPAAVVIAGATLPLLAELIDKSLIYLNATGRYTMHEQVRQYVEGILQQQPAAYRRGGDDHARFYLALLQAQEQPLKGSGIFDALAIISADFDNIRAAWQWALDQGQWSAIGVAAEALWAFYEIKGGDNNENLLQYTVTRVRARLAANPIDATTDTDYDLKLLLGRSLSYLAQLQTSHSRLVQAEATLEESLDWIAQAQRPAPSDRSLALLFLGIVKGWLGHSTAAFALLQESADLAKATGDRWRYGLTLLALGQLHEVLGQYAEMERLARASQTTLAALGEQHFNSRNFDTLGRLAVIQGHDVEASAHFQASLHVNAALGHRQMIALTYCELGEVARIAGDARQAESYFQQGLALGRELESILPIEQALWGLGCLAEGTGNYEAAHHYFVACRAINDGALLTNAMSAQVGWVAVGRQDLPAAMTAFGELLQRAATNQQPAVALEALVGLAYSQRQAGNPTRANALLTLVEHHPALRRETQDRAARLRQQWGVDGSPVLDPTGLFDNPSDDLWQTVDALLRELPDLAHR